MAMAMLRPALIAIIVLLVVVGAIAVGWIEVGLLLALAVLVALMSGVRVPIYLALMLFPLVLIAAQLRNRIEVASVPAPQWTVAAQRQRNVACADVFPPVTGKPAAAVTDGRSTPVNAERGMFLTDVLLRRLMIDLGKQRDWLTSSSVGLLTPLRLISAEFPDGKTHLAWYRGVVSDGRLAGAGVAFAYVDAESGQPLMLATDVVAVWDVAFECRDFRLSPQANDLLDELARRGVMFYIIGALALNILWVTLRTLRNRPKRPV